MRKPYLMLQWVIQPQVDQTQLISHNNESKRKTRLLNYHNVVLLAGRTDLI